MVSIVKASSSLSPSDLQDKARAAWRIPKMWTMVATEIVLAFVIPIG